jgi:hypothetical protein
MKKVIVLLVALVGINSAMAQWTYDNLSTPRDYMGAVVLGSKAYFAGGSNDSGLLSSVEIYNAQTGDWNTSFNLSVARECPFAVSCGSKVIFAGGVDFYISGDVFSTVDIYDTVDQSWTVEQLTVPRLQAAVVSHGSKVLFAGGANLQQGVVYDIVDIYDIETGEWSTASLSEPRVVWWATVGDLAIFAGGYDLLNSSKRVDIYNFTTDTWSIDSLSVPRAFIGMTTIGNKVLIAGGMTSGNNASNIVDIYDASTGNWSTANLFQARAFCDNQNAVTASGKAYFVGGGKINLNGAYWTTAYNVIDIYDEVDNSWSVDYMPIAPRIHHAVVATGNKVIIAGGYIMTPPYGCDSTVVIYTCPSSSCLPEGITFTTQEQIDNFQTNYPGCTEIEGDVTISGYNIANLNGLNVLTSIGGTLTIGVNGWMNNNLTSLTGLENLNFIGEDLLIGGTGLGLPGNPNLTSLTGLENLTSIGGILRIIQNPALTTLNGLEGLTSIGGNIFISYNGNLTNCAAQGICDYLTSPNGIVDIYNNGPGCISQTEVASGCGGSIPCLPYGNYYFLTQTDIENFQINFPGCAHLEGNFKITGNSISNLTGLNQVFSIGGNAEIESCGNLTNLSGLNNLSNVEGNLDLLYNESLINLSGLEYLNSIGGSFGLHENNQLLSLSGLENLDSIGGWLGIGTIYSVGDPPPPGGNPLLENLNSLASLTYVGGGIDIGQNNSLSSLAGLDNIDANSITDLLIESNSSLSTCEVKSVCDYLAAPNGTIEIHLNAPGCNSQEEVEAACLTAVEEIKTGNGITIIPNPSNDKITISQPLLTGIAQLSIFNVSGEKVIERQLTNNETQINISALPRGVYFVRLQNEKMVEVGKMVKK